MASWFDDTVAATFPEVAAICGETVTYTPRNPDVAPSQISAIILASDDRAAANNGAHQATILLSDLTATPVAGDRMAVGADIYAVVGVPSLDGHGLGTLNIRRVNA